MNGNDHHEAARRGSGGDRRNAPGGRLADAVAAWAGPLDRACRDAINRGEAQAGRCGMSLTFSTDFDDLARVNRDLDKLPLTPQFDPALSDLGPGNAFWLRGTDAVGRVVQTQAVRMDDLTDTSLARHLVSLRAFYRDPARTAHPAETCSVTAPAAHAIGGRVCYHGEFWLAGGAHGFRGRGLARVLPTVGFAIALAGWSPDFIYGTVQPAIVEKGIVARYGYPNLQPRGILWTRPQAGDVLDEWLMWMTWREIADRVARAGADRAFRRP